MTQPDYEHTDFDLADFRRRYGSPNTIDNLYPTVIYGWWVERDYISLRVTGAEHEFYRWIDCPLPMD